MSNKLGCIILAAGKGSRMNSDIPKPLHKVAGLSMVGHVIRNAEALNPDKIVVVIGTEMEDLAREVQPHATAIQAVANGTGGAVLAAKEHFKNFDGDILILYGDTPLVTTKTMQKMVDIRRQFPAIGLTFSGMELADPARYGRMVMDEDGTLQRIVEFKDASDEEKKITLCNGGIVCADGAQLFSWLERIDNKNAQNEYYLTDLPVIARKDNRLTHVVKVPPQQMAGANSRQELANLERIMQEKLRDLHMTNGATLMDPATTYFSYDTEVGKDVVIEPNVFFAPGVKIADNVHILANSHLEGTVVEEGASIGPFARTRPGTKVERKAVVGNFVETKNAKIGAGAKIKHLSYFGDVELGEKVNVGAGTIVCNYDGFSKHKTRIGQNASIGANTSLVAPLTIGENAIIGAGSTITEDVPSEALGITRANQNNIEGWAKKFRERKQAEKQTK